MAFTNIIRDAANKSIRNLYGQEFDNQLQVNETKEGFVGDYTVVLFSLVKTLRKKPEEIGEELGKKLMSDFSDFFSAFNVVKGFLNLSISDDRLSDFLKQNVTIKNYGIKPSRNESVMVEYSSPNTNKPLHLGHLRNIFLGWSMSEILKANGYDIVKTCIVNDRGIHICKSMIAWQLFAEGATPQSTQMKGDHFVGDYYVKFNELYQQQIKDLVAAGNSKEVAEKEAPVMKQAQEMLLKWEEGDMEVRSLWSRMNGWVYEGFDQTYQRLGTDFDKVYYESDTYLLGKEYVEEGLEKGVLFKKEDGSVWIDLTESNLDEKLLLRKDGTSVYITQDIGLALQKFEQFDLEKSIYVIGDEQLYHMNVLKETCKKLGFPFSEKIYHLSYGMVELTTGKMKSREGTVVDADDMIDEMIDTAASHTTQLGKVSDFTLEELNELYDILGLGAMKFYLLRVDPKKRMVFNPEESIDFHGFTGPFVQYTYARIQSILRKSLHKDELDFSVEPLLPLERQLLIMLEKFPQVIEESGEEMNPSLIAGYVFSVAKLFNGFYAEHSVTHAESENKRKLRLALSIMTANTIETGLKLLGIRVPHRM